jgi:eight-cysteine-cluster-containing protein
MSTFILSFVLVTACRTPAPAPAAAPAAMVPERGALRGDVPPPQGGKMELYAGCRDRVEGPTIPKECAADADCVTTGCSGEVCVARATAPTVMTTCEILPCFSVLDACACQEGACVWTLKDAAQPRGRMPSP